MRWIITLLLAASLTGCASSDLHHLGDDLVFLVPGVGGDGPGYAAMCNGLRAGGVNRPIITVAWGAPTALFMLNFTDPGVHRDAEEMLAEKIVDARKGGPHARIDLIGHSAGCGVVLGALKRLPPNVHVQTVLLLAPSISPQYPIEPALEHVNGAAHLFYSDRDTFFLDWRTGHFGTYDGVKSRAAGNTGMPGAKSPRL